MKKLLLIPVVVLVLTGFCALPVYADDPPDPPDMDVDIGISTPGDVDLDVEVNAGGDVDITVDGVDLRETANTAHLALARTGADGTGAINTADWWRYKQKYLDPLFLRLYTNADLTSGQVALITQAVAKLIQESEEQAWTINATDQKLEEFLLCVKENSGDISGLLVQDEVLWNKLTYGAEAHLTLLENKVDSEVARLEEENAHLRKLQTYYLYGFGGCIVLLGLAVVLSTRKRRYWK